MAWVREEMNLLAALHCTNDDVDAYAQTLEGVLAQKAEGIAVLQAQLAEFR